MSIKDLRLFLVNFKNIFVTHPYRILEFNLNKKKFFFRQKQFEKFVIYKYLQSIKLFLDFLNFFLLCSHLEIDLPIEGMSVRYHIPRFIGEISKFE